MKGLIRWAQCALPMWAQTCYSGNRYYREQRGSRGAACCLNQRPSLPFHVPDDQMGRIVGAMVLPEAWVDRVLARIKLADEMHRVDHWL